MMTPELTALALAALWQTVTIAIAAKVMNRDVGLDYNAGPRDRQPEFSALTGRLRRAVDNHFEGLVLFGIAVLVVSLSGASSTLTQGAAWVYLAARVLYVPAYAFGWTPWRSLIWAFGHFASVLMLLVCLF